MQLFVHFFYCVLCYQIFLSSKHQWAFRWGVQLLKQYIYDNCKKQVWYPSGDEHENFVTTHREATVDEIPIKPRNKCRISSESLVIRNVVNKRIYDVHTIYFQTFYVWVFKIVVDSWKFSILLLYILWDDWPILWFHVQMNSYSSNWNTPY